MRGYLPLFLGRPVGIPAMYTTVVQKPQNGSPQGSAQPHSAQPAHSAQAAQNTYSAQSAQSTYSAQGGLSTARTPIPLPTATPTPTPATTTATPPTARPPAPPPTEQPPRRTVAARSAPAIDPLFNEPPPAAAPPLPVRTAHMQLPPKQPAMDPLMAGLDYQNVAGLVPPPPLPARSAQPNAPPLPTRGAAFVSAHADDDMPPAPPPRPSRLGYMFVDLPEELPRAGSAATGASNNPKTMTLTSSKIQLPDTHGDMEKWQLERRLLSTLEPPLGTGFFGSVYRGTYRTSDGRTREVAAKTLHKDDLDEKDARLFLLEAQIMMEFSNSNILQLIGVLTTDEPWCIVTELCHLGDLRRLVKKTAERNVQLSVAESIRLLAQIAAGMAYLADRQFIHRDLAARNCLVTKDAVVKIGDFGMSRLVLTEDDYYIAQEEDALPIRWMALESMQHFKFSLRSDVWSFGVVCFEIFSRGGTPYGDLQPIILTHKVSEGARPERPADCPDDVWKLMQSCWDATPARRPNFRSIYAKLAEMHKSAITKVGVQIRDLSHVLRYLISNDPQDLDSDPYLASQHKSRDNSDDDDDGEDSLPYSQLTGPHKTYIKASLLTLPPLPASDTSVNTAFESLPYFHGGVSRQTAERLLMSQGRIHDLEGCFLVRFGSNPADLALSVVFDSKPRHYRIQLTDDGHFRFYGRDYDSLEHLVSEHKVSKNKLMDVLRHPCVKEEEEAGL